MSINRYLVSKVSQFYIPFITAVDRRIDPIPNMSVNL